MLIENTWSSLTKAYRPATTSAQALHFRTFVTFLKYFKLPITFELQHVLCFLQLLSNNGLQPKVISNYVASLRTMASWYELEHKALSHHSVFLLLRSFKINNHSTPSPKGIFDIHTLERIISSCSITSDPKLFRAIFSIAFFGFLRISNIAPHAKALFDPTMHLLRKDVFFYNPGCHIKIKWSKTNQSKRNVHWLQLPQLKTLSICPVRALYQLLESRQLPPEAPLFEFTCGQTIIDSTIRDMLKKILQTIGISL